MSQIINISWSVLKGASKYVLERTKVDSADWIVVYEGKNNLFADSISKSGGYRYRIKAVVDGIETGYTTGVNVSSVDLKDNPSIQIVKDLKKMEIELQKKIKKAEVKGNGK